MPKPFTGVSANGHHHHFTLIDDDGVNVFHDKSGPAQLSETARWFLGGLLEHFHALMCIGNPTVNSYCRMWDTGFWRTNQELGWQNRTTTVARASGGRSSTGSTVEHPYLTKRRCSSTPRRIRNKSDPASRSRQHLRPAAAGVEMRRCPTSLGAALEAPCSSGQRIRAMRVASTSLNH